MAVTTLRLRGRPRDCGRLARLRPVRGSRPDGLPGGYPSRTHWCRPHNLARRASPDGTQPAVVRVCDLQRCPEPFSALPAEPGECSVEVRLVAVSLSLRLEEQDYLRRKSSESE